MNQVSVKIDKRVYRLKFGYGVLKRLAHHFQKNTFEDLGNYIDGLKLSDGTLSFDGIDFLSQLILSAIQYEDASVEMDADYIVDTVVFKQPDVLGDVVTAFFESFPKGETEKKVQGTNKTPQKKTRK